MTLERSHFLAAICGLALVGAGCGGDDDNDTLSYDDTGTEISAICDKYDTDAEEAKITGKAEDDAEIIGGIVDSTRKAVEEMRGLEVDEQLANQRDVYADLGDEAAELAEGLRDAAEAGQQEYEAALKAAQKETEGKQAESNAVASSLGAEACIDKE